MRLKVRVAEGFKRLYYSSVIRVACLVGCLAVAGVGAALQERPPEPPRAAPAPTPAPTPAPPAAVPSPTPPSAFVSGPAAPLFDWTRDTTYLGAFKLPSTQIAGTFFRFNGTGLAFNDANQSLFIVSRDNDA